MEFAYQARDAKGVLHTGTVEAQTESLAAETLAGHQLTVIRVFPVAKISMFGNIKFFDRVSAKDLVLFSRQLATLINAKVPIVQALNVLELQVSSHKLKEVIEEIADKVESGNSLSSAIAEHPKVFSDLYANLIRSGELSGTLDSVLGYMADQLEREYELRQKVGGALVYPAFILSALVIVGFLMFIFVLPPLVEVLKESSVALPITTRILISVTNVVKDYWWAIMLIMAALGLGFRFYINTYSGKYVYDNFKLKLPVFGKLFERLYMARFARNLSTLLAGGIPIVRSLDSVAEIIGNRVFRDIILDASNQVRNGKSIASSLLDHKEIPPIVSQMVQIGESTGKLQDILSKLASFYEKEVESILKILTTLIEPLIMLVLGLAVAVMVAGILLPIYNLASSA